MRDDLGDGSITSLAALEVLLRRPAWHRDALCREPAYRNLPWIPDTGRRPDACRSVCARCLVTAECMSWALEQDNGRAGLQGFFGGLSRSEREAIQAGAQRAA